MLHRGEFLGLNLAVGCPRCHGPMAAAVGGNGKRAGMYAYACAHCQRYLLLADLLPRWEEMVAAPGEAEVP
jgi:hypothetical protein